MEYSSRFFGLLNYTILFLNAKLGESQAVRSEILLALFDHIMQ